jgi:DNA-binding transcriptional MerR regulator
MSEIRIADAIRKWRGWSSGSVDELAAVGTAFVWALGLEPLPETTATSQVNRRTIRYYISNGLMDPPEGERRLATYGYRHLLQLLYIKARQHAGDRLDDIRDDLSETTGITLERLVINALPDDTPPPVPDDPGEFARPNDLGAVLRRWAYLTGRAGRYRGGQRTAARSESIRESRIEESEQDVQMHAEIDLGDGVRLRLPADHPLVSDQEGRDAIVRGIQRQLRTYRNGGGPA